MSTFFDNYFFISGKFIQYARKKGVFSPRKRLLQTASGPSEFAFSPPQGATMTKKGSTSCKVLPFSIIKTCGDGRVSSLRSSPDG